jgi:hypothetical protein
MIQIGNAETGSGKTLAYALPGIVHLHGLLVQMDLLSWYWLQQSKIAKYSVDIFIKGLFGKFCGSYVCDTVIYGGVPKGKRGSNKRFKE